MKSSFVAPVSALLVVALGLLIVDVTTDTDWGWWAIAIALASAVRQIVRPGCRTRATGGG